LLDDSAMTPSITKWVGPAAGHYFRGVFLAHGWKPKVVERKGELYYGKPCDLARNDYVQTACEAYTDFVHARSRTPLI
jgi:hypothetical protein